MYDYGYIIVASWLIFIAVWIIGAFTAKRDVGSRSTTIRWLWQLLLLGLLIYALRNPYDDASIFGLGLFNFGIVVSWVGAFLTVVGVAFAIWARINLGRNWSSAPVAKENPKLVTSGPYLFVRHPIYTGVILAAFGTALSGTAFGIGVFLIASVIFSLRINKEEKIMLELFPNEYPLYQARTKRLIPFVW
jgi:protein-S-isoprenylcysteine O-methyltransferase Ste14